MFLGLSFDKIDIGLKFIKISEYFWFIKQLNLWSLIFNLILLLQKISTIWYGGSGMPKFNEM